MIKILETTRLVLREFDLQDSAFILRLVNTPYWLEFIGDKGVRTIKDARNYLLEGPIKSYQENGFGLWLVQLKNSNTPIGMCGLVNREGLENVDIGFALLPGQSNLGYGYEMASATLNFAIHGLEIEKIDAITDHRNVASIRLLNKIGLNFEKKMQLSKDDPVLLFSNRTFCKDRNELNKLTNQFYGTFNNINNPSVNINEIRRLFVPRAKIYNNTKGKHQRYYLEKFIDSRQELLTKGDLINFMEGELFHKTEIYHNIAHRLSYYGKSGMLNGVGFKANGMKTIQFIKMGNSWKICSVVWCDEA